MDAVAIVVADASGTIRQWSPGASRLFGHLPEDVLGSSLDVIVPERYRQAHWAAFAAVMAGGPGKLDGACANIPVRCHDEQVRVFPGRFSFVRDPYGCVIAAMATYADRRGDEEPFSPVAGAGQASASDVEGDAAAARRTHRVVPNLSVEDTTRGREFYRDFLGLEQAFDLGWVVSFRSRERPSVQVQLVSGDVTAAVDSQLSVGVSDIDSAYADAQRRGYEIVHPLTDETWGVRRFFVRDPNGIVVNIVEHPD